jgi:hypothetical protein
MKSKKLKVLFDTYEELSQELGKFDNSYLEKLIISWSKSINEVNEWLSDPDCTVKSSQITSGFEQGLRELPSLLVDLPVEIRSPVIQVFNQVVSYHLPKFFEKSKAQLQAIVSKGKIKNENDWHIVRLRMDDIEGQPNFNKEFEVLDELLRVFEEIV